MNNCNTRVRVATEGDANDLLVLASGLATSCQIEEDGFRNVFDSMLALDHGN
jgi:hypothetical protein